jgi:hypothetical protein
VLVEESGKATLPDRGLGRNQTGTEQGPDYEEVLHQRATEIRLMKELGLQLPDGAGSVAAAEATRTDQVQMPQ